MRASRGAGGSEPGTSACYDRRCDVGRAGDGDIAWGGGCVARAADGRVVFVRHALPGERVRAVITGETSSFLRADAVEVLEASPDRVPAPCRYSGPGGCGGCDWQHVALPAQRRLKERLVAEQLRRIAGIERRVVVEEVPGRPRRTGAGGRRVRFATDAAGRVGLRRHRSHDCVPVDTCLIATPGVDGSGVDRGGVAGGGGARGVRRVGRSRPPAGLGRPSRADRTVPAPEVPAGTVVDGREVRPPGRIRFEVLGTRSR